MNEWIFFSLTGKNTYSVCLTGLFDVMSSDDDRFALIVAQIHQMVPNAAKIQWN